jgi:hypothetical protein
VNKAIYNSTRDLAFPDGVYPDERRLLKQYRTTLEQGFRVNNILAFNNIQDQKNNNFSLNYITKPDLLTNFMELSTLKAKLETITTRLEFFKNDLQASKFVYIYNTTSNQEEQGRQRSIGVLDSNTGAFDNSYYFELDVLDDYFLRVRHNDGRYDFFLNWDESINKLAFFRSSDEVQEPIVETSDKFRYNIDSNGRVFLYKCFNDDLYVLSLDNDLNITMSLAGGNGIEVSGQNTIYVDYNFEDIGTSQNNDFISYKTGALNTLHIDTERSLFDDKGQYLFHCEYNDQDITSGQIKFNFFTLDTSRSEYGFVKRGANLFNANDDIPTFKYRTYNTLDTGNNEEGGNDKMSLIYTFYDKDVYIENGNTTIFRAPSSIYPFTKLNINDSTFTKNGAFSGPSPQIADKVYIKQDQPGQYNNGRYLCTWLSAGSPEDPGVWVDRYYYPDAVTKQQALGDIPKYYPSFFDNIDTEIAFSDSSRSNIAGLKFFDKKSDGVIKANTLIEYERVGDGDINDIVATSNPVISGFDNCIKSKSLRVLQNNADSNLGNITENICRTEISNTLTLDGTFYTKLSVYENINATKAFTISFDAYIDPEVQYGFELLGNNTDIGFGLFQDMTVTPFIHVAAGRDLKLLNTDGKLLNTIAFDYDIKDVFKLSALQDYIITCDGGNVYKVDAKGNKRRYEIANISNYINSYMSEDYIYFLMPQNIVRKVDANTFDVTTYTLGVDDIIVEFDDYIGGITGGVAQWYEGLVEYQGKVYLLPGCSKDLVWETDNIIFYTVKGDDAWYVMKHDFNKRPIKFLKTDCPVTDMEIKYSEQGNTIYLAIENQLYEYETTGSLVKVTNYDGSGDDAEDAEIAELGVAGGRILAIDTINEYIKGGVNSTYLKILFANADGDVVFDGGFEDSDLKVDIGFYIKTPLTNYNLINHIFDSNTLDFRLTLRNDYDKQDIRKETISYDPSKIDAGSHTFTFSFDSIQGNAALYVDGLLYDNITFEPGKFNIHNIFGDELFIGSAGFVHGADLSTYLKQPGYYYINNLFIKNFYMYDRAISTTNIYALNLLDSKIDRLVLSIPHGQRNNKASIERFYKLGRNNSSNKIDIVVNNFDISDENVLSQIRLGILEEAGKVLPAGVEVNSIQFSK